MKILPARPLAAGLPYHLIAKQSNFSEVADSQRLKFKYELYTQSYGEKDQLLFRIEQPTVQLAGKKLAMSFKPATQADAVLIASYIPEPDPVTGEIDPNDLPSSLPGYFIHLIPEFSIDNTTVTNTTQSMTMGTELISTMGYRFPNKPYQTTDNLPVAGQYEAIALDLQGASKEQSENLNKDMDKALLNLRNSSFENLSVHNTLGTMMYGLVLRFFIMNEAHSVVLSNKMTIVQNVQPSYGVYKTNLETGYWFGIPRNVFLAGSGMDMDRIFYSAVDKNNVNENAVNYIKLSGRISSSNESLIPKMMLDGDEAVVKTTSAIVAIQSAILEGQRVFYMDSNNIDYLISRIEINENVKMEIKNAINSGFVVYTHERPESISGMNGFGYIVEDSVTGSGAYKISNGSNGNTTDVILSGIGGFFDGQAFWANMWYADPDKIKWSKIAGGAGSIMNYYAIGDAYWDFLSGLGNPDPTERRAAFVRFLATLTTQLIANQLTFAIAGLGAGGGIGALMLLGVVAGLLSLIGAILNEILIDLVTERYANKSICRRCRYSV